VPPGHAAVFLVATDVAADQPIGEEPGVKAFRAARVEESSQQEKRRGRKQRNEDTEGRQCNTERSPHDQQKPRDAFYVAAHFTVGK